MKNFWKKHKIIVVIGAFLLVILPVFFLAATYILKRVQAKANLIQERILDANLEKSKIEKIPEMKEANSEFEKNKEAVGTILSANSKVDFIKYLEELAKETQNEINIKVLSDNLNKTEDKKVAKTETKTETKADGTKAAAEKSLEDKLTYKQYIVLQIDLAGNYDNFLNFIHKLENNNYYVNTLSLGLKKEVFSEEDSPRKQNDSGGMFSAPNLGQNKETTENGEEVKEEKKEILKSSLKIIVYVE